MSAALAEFHVAVQDRGDQIKNYSAYLVGVLKRYHALQEVAGDERGGALSERVAASLDNLISSGYCHKNDIDGTIKNKLSTLTEFEGLSAIEELCRTKRENIRSFPGYFMGIMKRYSETYFYWLKLEVYSIRIFNVSSISHSLH